MYTVLRVCSSRVAIYERTNVLEISVKCFQHMRECRLKKFQFYEQTIAMHNYIKDELVKYEF